MTETLDYVGLQAKLQPSVCAARDLTTGAHWTYAQFDRTVSQFAAQLRVRGIGQGDRVAALAKNCVELILLHLACARIEAIYVPLNWRLTAPELATVIADAEPGLLLGDVSLARANLKGTALDEFAADAGGLAPLLPHPADPDAPSLILYTSGTSGRPKGVLLTERNLWHTGLNLSLLARFTHKSVVLCDSPMFHVIGLVANTRPVLMRGGTIAVSDGFDASRTFERLSDPKLAITHYFCVPQMATMLRAVPKFDPDKLRRMTAILSGGAPHPAAAIQAWCRDGIPIADGFGMSEAGTVSCMPVDIAAIEARAGSAGLIPTSMSAQIRADEGHECAVGEPGELMLKGPNVTRGYWRNPDATRAAFDRDGWFRTGDIAYFDADGFLWLVDRKKDMFISGGENVYPAEIEAVLAGHADILECAVVGIPDVRWGEVGHLAVVTRDGAALNFVEVLAFLEPHVARYKLPKHFSIVTALPRNGAGKVLKAALRAVLRTAT